MDSGAANKCRPFGWSGSFPFPVLAPDLLSPGTKAMGQSSSALHSYVLSFHVERNVSKCMSAYDGKKKAIGVWRWAIGVFNEEVKYSCAQTNHSTELTALAAGAVLPIFQIKSRRQELFKVSKEGSWVPKPEFFS